MPLFGGAVLCDLPTGFTDASAIREVPDNQEVWVDEASDRSVVVEVLEARPDVPNDQALAFFLADLAAFNDAQHSEVLWSRPMLAEEIPGVGSDARCFTGVGEQTVAKFKESCRNRVRIYACAVRLGAQQADVLVTLNDPVAIDPQSSSRGAPVARGGAELVFERILRSFRIVDWALFNAP